VYWRDSPREEWPSKLLADKLAESGVELAHFHFGGNYAWRNRKRNASPVLAARKRGIRCVSTNHGFFSPFEGYCAPYRPFWAKLLPFPFAWIAKVQTLRALEREYAVSQYDLRELQRWYPTERFRFGQIYHSRIHPKPGDDIEAEREKIILCVGTFGSRKGQPVLAEAFSHIAHKHPDWKLVFAGRVGDSPDWNQIRTSYERRGLSNQLVHRENLSHEQLEGLFKEAAVFVMPSLYEGLGLSLQEALYFGCACIATRCGGPEDLIIDGENGLLIPKGDPIAMSKALDTMLSDDGARARFGARGRPFILERKMTAPDMVSAYRSIYTEML
jgi:glycosyltransferase involved in cell wall biosynthesis